MTSRSQTIEVTDRHTKEFGTSKCKYYETHEQKDGRVVNKCRDSWNCDCKQVSYKTTNSILKVKTKRWLSLWLYRFTCLIDKYFVGGYKVNENTMKFSGFWDKLGKTTRSPYYYKTYNKLSSFIDKLS